MSKKSSSAILKNKFLEFKDISKIYLDFKKKIDQYKLKTCAVAISGGPDSLALAALSKAYSYEKKTKFTYILINHNIRSNSSNEAKKVKKLLEKQKINLNIINNKSIIRRNVQSEARNVRYELISNFCKLRKIKIVMTAHNLEDQVETFFIRLSRGSGLTGLSAMKPLSKLNANIRLYRPLLGVKKKFLIKVSKLIFGKFFKDPSNKNKKYLRTKIRELEKPLRSSGINYDQIIKSINNLASSNEILDEYFRDIFKEITKFSKKELQINLKDFLKLREELKIKVINESVKKLRNNYYNPRSKKVINLIRNIEGIKSSSFTLAGCEFYKKRNKLCVKKEYI